MSVPEALKVGTAGLLGGGEDHGSKRNQHDVSRPARAGDQVSEDEAHEAEALLRGQLGVVVPVCNGVDPRKEEDCPCHELVEGDILVELDDAV